MYDWPLLERVVQTELPIIASTGGGYLSAIDEVVKFLGHRKRDFVLMHCVGEYPTANKDLQMNQIDLLSKRYPEVRIGFSTHEKPSETLPVSLAIAKGCTLFEKHVGVPTEAFALNDYSGSPAQVRAWLGTAQEAFLGMRHQRPRRSQGKGNPEPEVAAPRGLRQSRHRARRARHKQGCVHCLPGNRWADPRQ